MPWTLGDPGLLSVASVIYSPMERATGIEPAYSAWEADVLPLNYAREDPYSTRGVVLHPMLRGAAK